MESDGQKARYVPTSTRYRKMNGESVGQSFGQHMCSKDGLRIRVHQIMDYCTKSHASLQSTVVLVQAIVAQYSESQYSPGILRSLHTLHHAPSTTVLPGSSPLYSVLCAPCCVLRVLMF
jgi:hypothetical protein